MSLLVVRRLLAEQSGRLDLIHPDGTDNGLDYFINAAQRFLDTRSDYAKKHSWYIKTSLITTGEYKIELAQLKSVDSVQMIDGDLERINLIPRTLTWMQGSYTIPMSASGYGTPVYYALYSGALAPTQAALDATDFTEVNDYQYQQFGSHWHKMGVLWLPATDRTMTLKIKGVFEYILSADADETFWTENHPDILILASMMKLEEVYRNVSGRESYRLMVEDELLRLSGDEADQDIQGTGQMEDSWDT